MTNQPMNEQTITLKLSVSEFNFLHAILGDLPTKTNAWVLLNNLESQAKAQAEAQNIPVVNTAAETAPAAAE
jgi:hypothetical protein